MRLMASHRLRMPLPPRRFAQAWGGTAAGALAVAGVIFTGGITSGAATVPNTITTYTWSGTASAAGTSINWSTGGNWKGGVAPTSASTVNLNFPAFTKCTTITTCGTVNSNDVIGLKAGKWTIADNNGASEPGPGEYQVGGGQVGVGALVIKSVPAVSGKIGNDVQLNLPIHLLHNDIWTMETNSNGQPQFLQPITGTGSLTVHMNSPASFADFDSTANVGPVSFVGTTPGDTFANGIVALFGTINSNGHPVGLTNVGFFVPATATVGPLTTTADTIQIGSGGGIGPFGIFSVDGALTLDSASVVSFIGLTPGTGLKPVPGTTYTEATATGVAALNNAILNNIYADCGQKIGTVYTLISAKGGLSGTFASDPNGKVIQAQKDSNTSCSSSTAVAPSLKLTYNDTAGTLKATVVAAAANPSGVVAPAVAGPTWQAQSAGGAGSATTTP